MDLPQAPNFKRISGLAPPVQNPTPQGRPLLDNGKPAVRRGRKATGQATNLIAGLPKEGVGHPREHWWSPQKEETNVFESGRRGQLGRAWPHLGRTPPRRTPPRRNPG